MAAKSNPNELHITRVYDAPVEAVWDAWTDPQQVAQWWGPRGFTITTHSKDLRTGGHWHYTMHGPDGKDWPNKTKYLEVDPLKRLVYDHGANDEQAPLFRVTVLFRETKGKTTMDMTMALATAEAAAETKKFIKKAGGDGTWDRLAEYLTKQATGQEQFVINRVFDAPIDTMWEMWTNPKHVAQWTPPVGATMQFVKADIRPGGASFYKMDWAGGSSMYGKAQYLEMERPHRIVYTQGFADEHGNTARHPMAPTWPETMRTTVLLSEESDGKTRVTVTWDLEGKVTAEEVATFVGGRAGMQGGWTGSFDKLEDYVAQRAA
jgi:uncharacterized protein YndB with AHSA1/START domain